MRLPARSKVLPGTLRSTTARPARNTGAFITKTGPGVQHLPSPTPATQLPLTVQTQTFTHPIKPQGR